MNDRELLETLAGAVWRLEDYGYMRFECAYEEDEEQMNHWVELMRWAVKEAQKGVVD